MDYTGIMRRDKGNIKSILLLFVTSLCHILLVSFIRQSILPRRQAWREWWRVCIDASLGGTFSNYPYLHNFTLTNSYWSVHHYLRQYWDLHRILSLLSFVRLDLMKGTLSHKGLEGAKTVSFTVRLTARVDPPPSQQFFNFSQLVIIRVIL